MTVLTTNPEVLKWAREIRNVSVEDAARLLDWEVAHLVSIEDGTVDTTEADLERMARAYKLPVATLLMPQTLPADQYGPRPLTDFRLHVGGDGALSPATQQYIENAWELLDLLFELGDVPNLPPHMCTEDASQVAATERERIGFSIEEQLGWADDRTAFLKWRTRIEQEGIVVHALNIKEEDVRGIALFHKGAAYIAINKNEDTERAKIFSLFHEYAHLLLGQNGVSDQNRTNPIERWCNRFAAEFLLPREAVLAFCRENRLLDRAPGNWHINRVSSAFKVSKSAVAIRFEELGIAHDGFYEEIKKTWRQPIRRPGFDPDGNQVKKELNRYGTRHVAAVMGALQDGRIDRVEARYALDVNPEYHNKIHNAARERVEAYGRRRAG